MISPLVYALRTQKCEEEKQHRAQAKGIYIPFRAATSHRRGFSFLKYAIRPPAIKHAVGHHYPSNTSHWIRTPSPTALAPSILRATQAFQSQAGSLSLHEKTLEVPLVPSSPPRQSRSIH